MAQRFGGAPPWLDAYAASGPEEFFAVTAEAYFVKNHDFRHDFPALASLYDAFFKPNPQLLLAA